MEATRPSPPAGTHDERRLVGADRVLAVLCELAGHAQGITLEEMTRTVGSPKPTVHRALAALRRVGFADQDGRGRYVLGDEFLRLAFAHHEERPDHVRVQPALDALAQRYGETAHYAVLDVDSHVVYRAKADPPAGGLRLTSTVGGRNLAHCTAVGKLLLALTLPDDDAVRRWAAGRTLDRRTPATITSVEGLVRELSVVRARRWATDDQENERGIVCLALPAHLVAASVPSGAISLSALEYRMSLSHLVAELPALRRDLARILDRPADDARTSTVAG